MPPDLETSQCHDGNVANFRRRGHLSRLCLRTPGKRGSQTTRIGLLIRLRSSTQLMPPFFVVTPQNPTFDDAIHHPRGTAAGQNCEPKRPQQSLVGQPRTEKRVLNEQSNQTNEHKERKEGYNRHKESNKSRYPESADTISTPVARITLCQRANHGRCRSRFHDSKAP
jgi:hypothetical protein